jgi:hypothetical protein
MDAATAWQELEQRVSRLEEALAQQATVIEETVIQKVISRLKALAAERRHLLSHGENDTAITPSLSTSTVTLPPEPPPEGVILPMPTSPLSVGPESGRDDSPPHPLWSWMQSLADLRLVVAMYFDSRYRMSRLTQWGLRALIGLVVFDYFFFAVWFTVPFISPILERLLIVLATLIAYKLVKMELIRYRRARDYISRWYNHHV